MSTWATTAGDAATPTAITGLPVAVKMIRSAPGDLEAIGDNTNCDVGDNVQGVFDAGVLENVCIGSSGRVDEPAETHGCKSVACLSAGMT